MKYFLAIFLAIKIVWEPVRQANFLRIIICWMKNHLENTIGKLVNCIFLVYFTQNRPKCDLYPSSHYAVLTKNSRVFSQVKYPWICLKFNFRFCTSKYNSNYSENFYSSLFSDFKQCVSRNTSRKCNKIFFLGFD